MPRQRYWLVKSEPEVFSFEELWRARGRTTRWDGVRNYQARNFLRDELRVGDGVLFYHSSCEPPGVAGLARVVRAGFPDPSQFNPRDPHFDPASPREEPRWYAVGLQATRRLARFVPLDELRAEPGLSGMALLRRGNRLSVLPVSAAEWKIVLRLGGVS
jgi:predicted RNA-binding protein with PUA-like domain